jgi:hypothetical protein
MFSFSRQTQEIRTFNCFQVTFIEKKKPTKFTTSSCFDAQIRYGNFRILTQKPKKNNNNRLSEIDIEKSNMFQYFP